MHFMCSKFVIFPLFFPLASWFMLMMTTAKGLLIFLRSKLILSSIKSLLHRLVVQKLIIKHFCKVICRIFWDHRFNWDNKGYTKFTQQLTNLFTVARTDKHNFNLIYFIRCQFKNLTKSSLIYFVILSCSFLLNS